MLFLHCACVFWSPTGFPGLLAACTRTSDRCILTFSTFEWLVGILGLIFAPWTALMYVIVFPIERLGLALARLWNSWQMFPAMSAATTTASRCLITQKPLP